MEVHGLYITQICSLEPLVDIVHSRCSNCVNVLFIWYFVIFIFFRKMIATPPPFRLTRRLCITSKPLGTRSCSTALSTSVPSHDSVRAITSIIWSHIDIALFFTDLQFYVYWFIDGTLLCGIELAIGMKITLAELTLWRFFLFVLWWVILVGIEKFKHTLDSFLSGEISIRFLEITHLWWPHKLIFLWQDTTLIHLATLRPPLDPRLVGLKLNGQQVFTSAGVNISNTKNKQNSNNKFMVDW